MISGNTKKFLYTGAKKDDPGEDQWIFSPRKETNPVSGKLVQQRINVLNLMLLQA